MSDQQTPPGEQRNDPPAYTPPPPPDQPAYTPPPPPPPEQPAYTPPPPEQPAYTPPPPPPEQPAYTPPPPEQPAYAPTTTQERPAPPPYLPPYVPAPWYNRPLFRFGLAFVLFVTGVIVFLVGRGGGSPAAAGEIFLQGSDVPGTATFTPSIAAPPPAQKAPNATESPQPGQGIATTRGDKEGLYAAQRDVPSCNAAALITYLEGNQDRARPWAAALGINAADVRAYVNTLTPVLLRTDTRVTDFGFADGRAVPRQSILQAGTAVLIDRTGVPRVRCASGNPLGEPRAVQSNPQYEGPRWQGFLPGSVILVNPAPATTTIVVVDVTTGAIFVRIPGSIVIIDIDRPPAGTILIIVEPGGPARITGANWPPGTPVTITFDNPAVTLATVNADGAGNIAADVVIPDTAAPGIHTVTIAGGGFTVPQTVYVIPRAPTARIS